MMSFSYVLYLFGGILTVLAALMLIPLAVAGVTGEIALAGAFAGAASGTAFFGVGLMLGLRDARPHHRMRDAVLLVFLAWFIAPCFAALPLFEARGIGQLTNVIFESVSALTTTGATTIDDVDSEYRSVLAWRAVLQWAGGLGTIVMGAAIVSALGFLALPVYKPTVQSIERLSVLERLGPFFRYLLPPYAGLALAGFVVLWMSGLPRFEAFCLALSAVSTGGFSISNEPLLTLAGTVSLVAIMALMVAGAINFAVQDQALRLRFRPAANETEIGYLFAILVAVSLLVFWLTTRQAGDGSLFEGIFHTVSLLSTTGFVLGGLDSLSGIPPVIVLTLCFIGGSALSAAGGLKLVRLIILYRQSLSELNRLAHPHSILRIPYGGRHTELASMTAIWIYFFALLALVGAFAIMIGAWGYDFQTSLAAATLMLSNAGPVFPHLAADGVTVASMPDPAKWILCLAMILGRVEILILLPVFDASYWRS